MKVLVTRPEPDASAFAELCQAHNITPIVSPVMEVIFHSHDVELSNTDALAFTSANGVRAFMRNSGDRSLPVYAVGEATAATARGAGFNDVTAADGDVSALASLIDRQLGSRERNVLHIAGEKRAGDLVGDLQARGFKARCETLYEMRRVEKLNNLAVAALSNEPVVDWVTLFSPESATMLSVLMRGAGISGRLNQTRAACMSDAIAEVARNQMWKSVEVTKHRHMNAMIDLISTKS